jgi:hypothetical protein
MPRLGLLPQKALRGHAKFLSPNRFSASRTVSLLPNSLEKFTQGAAETPPRSFHVFCSEQDASAFRFRLVAREPQLMCGAMGGAHPYRDIKNITVYLAEIAKNEPKNGPEPSLTDCHRLLWIGPPGNFQPAPDPAPVN